MDLEAKRAAAIEARSAERKAKNAHIAECKREAAAKRDAERTHMQKMDDERAEKTRRASTRRESKILVKEEERKVKVAAYVAKEKKKASPQDARGCIRAAPGCGDFKF